MTATPAAIPHRPSQITWGMTSSRRKNTVRRERSRSSLTIRWTGRSFTAGTSLCVTARVGATGDGDPRWMTPGAAGPSSAKHRRIGTRTIGRTSYERHKCRYGATISRDLGSCLVIIRGMASCEIRRIGAAELDSARAPVERAQASTIRASLPTSGTRAHAGSPGSDGVAIRGWLAESEGVRPARAARRGSRGGYAMVHVREGSPTWPSASGRGARDALRPARRARQGDREQVARGGPRRARRQAGSAKCRSWPSRAIEQAIRFYERRGFSTHALWMRAAGRARRRTWLRPAT